MPTARRRSSSLAQRFGALVADDVEAVVQRSSARTVGTWSSFRYTYDANGNRLSATTPAGTETGQYDVQDRLLTYGGA